MGTSVGETGQIEFYTLIGTVPKAWKETQFSTISESTIDPFLKMRSAYFGPKEQVI